MERFHVPGPGSGGPAGVVEYLLHVVELVGASRPDISVRIGRRRGHEASVEVRQSVGLDGRDLARIEPRLPQAVADLLEAIRQLPAPAGAAEYGGIVCTLRREGDVLEVRIEDIHHYLPGDPGEGDERSGGEEVIPA